MTTAPSLGSTCYRTGPAFRPLPPTRVIDQDVPHHARGRGEEVGAVLPVRIRLVRETQIRLIDQRGGFAACDQARSPRIYR